MRRRLSAGPRVPPRLLSYRAEEWASLGQWQDARAAWEARGGSMPIPGPDDVDRAAAWDWHRRIGTFAGPEEWRAAMHAWEDEHGRLLLLPDMPFEPSGRGVYDISTGRWRQSI